jgi:hypothetical protein
VLKRLAESDGILTSSDDTILQGSRVTCRAHGLIIPLKPGIIHRSIYQPGSIFRITIAIAIKNRSGKIDQRFSFRNRSAISGSKSITEFHFQIDQRLKNGFRNKNSDGTQNRIAIFVRKSITDFHFTNAIRFSDQNRDHDRDQKLFRKNRSAISGSKSDPVFRFEINPRLKNGFRNKSSDGTQKRIPILFFIWGFNFQIRNRDHNRDSKIESLKKKEINLIWNYFISLDTYSGKWDKHECTSKIFCRSRGGNSGSINRSHCCDSYYDGNHSSTGNKYYLNIRKFRCFNKFTALFRTTCDINRYRIACDWIRRYSLCYWLLYWGNCKPLFIR